MTEEKTTDQDPTAETGAPERTPVKHHYVSEGFRNRTRGEAKFNKQTYIGVGYFGAIAASLLLTFGLKDSKTIAPHFKKFTDWITNLTKGAKTGEALEKHKNSMDSLTTILSMFTGTTLITILPVKWQEDHKPELVKKYDEEFYGKYAVEHDPALRQAHEEIANAPKQTWKSVIGSRVVAFAATMGTNAVIGHNGSLLAKATGHSIDKHSIGLGRWIDKALHHSNPKIIAEINAAAKHSPTDIDRKIGNTDRVLSRVGSYLALDGFYTVITGGVLFVFTRLFAPIFDKEIRERAREEKWATQDADYHRNHAVPAQTATPTGPALSISDAALAGRVQDAPERAATV